MFILSHTHHLTHLIWNEHTVTLTDNSGPVHCAPWQLLLPHLPKQLNLVLE